MGTLFLEKERRTGEIQVLDDLGRSEDAAELADRRVVQAVAAEIEPRERAVLEGEGEPGAGLVVEKVSFLYFGGGR